MTASSDIKLIVSDVDGVWTDGKIIYSGDTRQIKEFNVRDGLAVKIAQKSGIKVAVVTSRRSRALSRRCEELGISDIIQGSSDKLADVRKLAKKHSVGMNAVCYLGDDLPDLAPMSAAAISAAPADAAPEVRELASWKLDAKGGQGAFREVVERLLKERGEWAGIVDEFHGAKIATPNV